MNQIVYGLSMGCELQVKLNSINYLITQKEIRKPYKIEWNKEESNAMAKHVPTVFVFLYVIILFSLTSPGRGIIVSIKMIVVIGPISEI